MKMLFKVLITFISLITLFTLTIGCESSSKPRSEKVQFKSEDGVTVTADLYVTSSMSSPFILLCHQAGSSRGEYLEIAPKLTKSGFNCMAIDQRSGGSREGITNETNADAKKLGVPCNYEDSIKDIEASLKYIKDELKVENSIIWGSSYSASLAFIAANKNPDFIKGVIAFSPGEYFTFENKKIEDYAATIYVPVFISSTKGEEVRWNPIYEKIPSEKKVGFLPEKAIGKHGSAALYKTTTGNEEYWAAINKFLDNFKEK